LDDVGTFSVTLNIDLDILSKLKNGVNYFNGYEYFVEDGKLKTAKIPKKNVVSYFSKILMNFQSFVTEYDQKVSNIHRHIPSDSEEIENVKRKLFFNKFNFKLDDVLPDFPSFSKLNVTGGGDSELKETNEQTTSEEDDPLQLPTRSINSRIETGKKGMLFIKTLRI
jgi:hypothetical protein